MTRPSAIRVHIGSLVVHGLGGMPREALRAAVASELGRRLTEGAAGPSAWLEAHHDRMDAGSFRVRPADGTAGLGAQIGAAVHRKLRAP